MCSVCLGSQGAVLTARGGLRGQHYSALRHQARSAHSAPSGASAVVLAPSCPGRGTLKSLLVRRAAPALGSLSGFRVVRILGVRCYSQAVEDAGSVTGPRHYPSLSHTLRNTRGRELLRIVDTAVPNLKHIKEFSVVLRALAIDGQWRRAIRLLREMRDIGIEPNSITYNGLLSAMQKDKQVDKALTTLEEMRGLCITPDIISYQNCVGACKPSEWARTLQILDNMPGLGMEPDGQCFEYAAAACEEGGEWQLSLILFMEIANRGLKSSSVGHNYALSACRQGKQWRHGFEIIDAMRQRDFEPDFRLKQDIEAQSRGLDRAPPPEPQPHSSHSPDSVWQRKQQLRELREQDKRRQEERKQEEERQDRERRERERRERLSQDRKDGDRSQKSSPSVPPKTRVLAPGMREVTLSFEAGLLGIEYVPETGGVVRVASDGQASSQGVAPGWIIAEVGGTPFSDVVYRAARQGGSSFVIKFHAPKELPVAQQPSERTLKQQPRPQQLSAAPHQREEPLPKRQAFSPSASSQDGPPPQQQQQQPHRQRSGDGGGSRAAPPASEETEPRWTELPADAARDAARGDGEREAKDGLPQRQHQPHRQQRSGDGGDSGEGCDARGDGEREAKVSGKLDVRERPKGGGVKSRGATADSQRGPRPKLRSPGSYVLPVFAQHDRSNHAERQALIKVIARVQNACGAQTDDQFEAECAEVTGTVRLYASHTPCISCMACFCQFQRLFPKVKLCVDFDDWRDTRRMVEMARREEEYKRRGIDAPTYDCEGLSDMSDEEEPGPAEPTPVSADPAPQL